MEEIWKDIVGYEGLYQVSNFGNVKSLNYNRSGKERTLKPSLRGGCYLAIDLSKNGKPKTQRIHQLVAIAFLGHQPNGYKTVINHIDNNPLNNHIYNLEILTKEGNISAIRKNLSYHKTDVGVHWDKTSDKWKVEIFINGKNIHLGRFINKQEALDTYQKALANIRLYNGDNKAFRLALTTVTL